MRLSVPEVSEQLTVVQRCSEFDFYMEQLFVSPTNCGFGCGCHIHVHLYVCSRKAKTVMWGKVFKKKKQADWQYKEMLDNQNQ